MDIRSSRCKPRNASIISQGETGLNHDVREERCVLMNPLLRQGHETVADLQRMFFVH